MVEQVPPAVKSPLPQARSAYPDVTYVVFCRLEEIIDLPADVLGATVETLAMVVHEVCEQITGLESHSSVYGRLIIVPRRAQQALDVAKELHEKTAKAGVRLAIGVAGGRVEQTQDLTRNNIAGTVVNIAARLAHLEGGGGRVAVDEITFEEASRAVARYSKKAFGNLQEGEVKRTKLRYFWLEYHAPLTDHPPLPRHYHEAETAHIVAYDVVRFSDNEIRDLVQVVEDLNHAVRRALGAAGGQHLIEGNNLWYAPAGDGGVLVFRADRGSGSRAAWSFANSLLNHTNERISLRVGLTSGPIVVLKGDLPVGSGIMLSDRLCGLAEAGKVCVSRRFWENVLERADKFGWHVQPVPSSEDALIVHRESFDAGSNSTSSEWGSDSVRRLIRGDKSKDQPPIPPPIRDKKDAQKGRWGGISERDGRKLTASIRKAKTDLFLVDIAVESTDGSQLEGPCKFHLGSTFPKSVIMIRKIQADNTAVLKDVAFYKPFTAAAQVRNAQGIWVSLELDLSCEKNFPNDFLDD